MEPPTMGKVIVTAKVENMDDLVMVYRGHLKPEEARSVEITDALADTGASTLSLPKRLVAQLGLRPSARGRRGPAPVRSRFRCSAQSA